MHCILLSDFRSDKIKYNKKAFFELQTAQRKPYLFVENTGRQPHGFHLILLAVNVLFRIENSQNTSIIIYSGNGIILHCG